MKRLKCKETIPTDTNSKTYPFDWIPLDMKEEILMKLKGKYISKFMGISKSWSSIVRSKGFTNLYLTRSLARPRILFSIIDRRDFDMQFFHSCSQEDPTSDHHRVSCYPPKPDNWYAFSTPVRGLICCLNDKNKVMIGNPSTCQFITLPRVKTSRKDIFFFFGYDPVGGEYKVLCMTVSRHKLRSGDLKTEEYQVFTLGARIKRWKTIECTHTHYTPPRTQGICNNGVVYYLAQINHVNSLICFDVGSEKFSVVKLPGNVRHLSNYSEKIAVTNLLFDGALDLWVLEDANKQEWSKVSILIPSWTDICLWYQTFKFKGRLGTGELIFAPCFAPIPFFLLCYDLKEKKARKIEIEGVNWKSLHFYGNLFGSCRKSYVSAIVR